MMGEGEPREGAGSGRVAPKYSIPYRVHGVFRGRLAWSTIMLSAADRVERRGRDGDLVKNVGMYLGPPAREFTYTLVRLLFETLRLCPGS